MRISILIAAVPMIAGASLAAANAQDISNLGSPREIQLAQTVIIAPSAPPALRVETPPPPPSRTLIWEPGRWNWSGTDWQWTPGRYAQPPMPQEAWVPGHWNEESQGWIWEDGHWQ
jgi:hypothetical protein